MDSRLGHLNEVKLIEANVKRDGTTMHSAVTPEGAAWPDRGTASAYKAWPGSLPASTYVAAGHAHRLGAHAGPFNGTRQPVLHHPGRTTPVAHPLDSVHCTVQGKICP